ncbi:MAG: hypothetical protein WBZ37_19315, partial [Mycobacterium sp.]
MFNYTTCADCHGILNATESGQTVHPGCTPHPTALDALTADWEAAARMGDQPELEASLQAE